jgi:hypothetical protein
LSNLPIVNEDNPENNELLKLEARLKELNFDPLKKMVKIADDMDIQGDIEAQKVSLSATKEVQRILDKARDRTQTGGGSKTLNVLLPTSYNADGTMNFEVAESFQSNKLNGKNVNS